MKKVFYLFILLFIYAKVVSQNNCEIIVKAIDSDFLQKNFHFEKITSDTIVLYYLEDNIIDCTNFYTNSKFIVNKEWINKNNWLHNKNCKENEIVIYNVVNQHNIYWLFFYQPYTGAVVKIKIKFTIFKKLKIKEYSRGAF